MADQPVTREKLINTDIDVENLGKAMNELGIVNPRYGEAYPTLPSAIQTVIESGGFEPFLTEVALKASTPTLTKKAAYALDTHKVFLYESGAWVDTGLSSFDKSVNLVNSFSSLTKNSTVLYPFSSLKRNGVEESVIGTHDNILRSYILNARVMNADPTKYYRLQQMTNPTYPTNPNRWVFEVLNRTNFDTVETVEKTIVTEFPIVKNTGIKTFTVSDGDLIISVTVDTNKAPGNNFYSVTSGNNSYTYIIDPSLYSYAAVTSSDINAVNTRIDKFTKPMQLKNLLNDLRNPIQSVQIKLLGDSITWGVGATDVGNAAYPSVTAKSWANILRDYIGTTFATSVRNDIDALIDGKSYFTASGKSVISSQLDYFTFRNTVTGKVFTTSEMQALTGSLASSPEGTYVDLRSPLHTATVAPNEVEFDFNGSDLILNFAKFSNGSESESVIDVFVDDVFHSSFSVYASSSAFGFQHTINGLQNGRKKIKIKNQVNNSLVYLRLVSIEATRKISIINKATSGSNTITWINSNWIAERVSIADNYVFMQLGTNDRHNTKKIGAFKNQYLTLLDQIKTASPQADIIIMSPPAVTQSEDPVETVYQFRISDLNYCLSEIAKLRNLSFISNFEVTSKMKAKGEVFLSDGLHPNDYGYSVIADHIINQIINA